MKTEEKALIKGKKIESLLGIFLLIPPFLGVIFFVFCLFGDDGKIARLYYLSSDWTMGYDEGGGGMSAAPLYLALMAIAGAYLVKDSIKYLFMSTGEKKEESPETSKPKAESES